ncbi:MAG: hypothetical protein JSR17_11870 [Proteobacteria bacterium]|nr:hypothetical protein [Pseudomonadota bacterium]
MQGVNDRYFKKHKHNNNLTDIFICRQDGIYCPTVNFAYQKNIKAGQTFPLYRGKKTRWLLVDEVKDFVLSNNQ